jgi:hypothetical protein
MRGIILGLDVRLLLPNHVWHRLPPSLQAGRQNSFFVFSPTSATMMCPGRRHH